MNINHCTKPKRQNLYIYVVNGIAIAMGFPMVDVWKSTEMLRFEIDHFMSRWVFIELYIISPNE